jgi:predicted DNA-binding protein (UPF0251 family)
MAKQLSATKRKGLPSKMEDRPTMLRYMRLLEMNDMNKTQTARELGLHRNTFLRYYKRYWEDYQTHKVMTMTDMEKVEAEKLVTIEGFNVIRNTISATLDLAIKRATEILNDEEKLNKLNARDLVQLINVLAPYVAEKRGILGANNLPDKKNGLEQHTTFVQNIINELNVKKEYTKQTLKSHAKSEN